MRARVVIVVALLVGTGVAFARPVPLRGVVEGYYGRPWSGEARRDVIAFMGAHGLNAFVYGPKNDPYHRARWREPYPDTELADLGATASAARRAHVRFTYALSPALDVCYACAEDFTALTAKLAQVASAGVHRFALFFDDAPATLARPEDVARYGGSDAAALARAQVDLANRTARWLRGHRKGALKLLVPTDYAGTECSPYHQELAHRLKRGLLVGWTGPGVFAEEISGAAARARAACLRHPVALWDNYPVNDTVLSINLHLGPFTGRAADLPSALGAHLLNPMTQAHASLVALGTAAAYFRAPRRYDPEAAWQATLAELSPSAGLAVLAENTRSSALDLDDARALAGVVDGVQVAYAGADWTAPVAALETELVREAAAPPAIAAALGATPLGMEVRPWADELAEHAARGAVSVRLLRAMKPDFFADLVAMTGSGLLHVSGHALPPDTATANALGPSFATEAAAIAARIAHPDIPGFIACLGNLIGADIRFCTDYGLNVHGKALFILIRTVSDIETVTDRNVYDRLIRNVGTAYDDWAARRGPGSDAVGLTLEGASVPLGLAGAFDVTVPLPASGRGRLVVTTAAGEATAREVP